MGRGLVALGVLCVASGLSFSTAAASGESTTAVLTSPLSGSSDTFTWSYEFHANGGHELSNIAIAFCSTDILPHVVSASPAGERFLVGDVPGGHPGFGPGVKFGATAVSGTLTVVFDQPYPAGGSIAIQSHSGDGNTGDLVTTASGPGSCNPTTTTAPPTTTTLPSTTTTASPVTTPGPTTTIVPATTTTAPPTTTTLPATTTTGPPTTTTVPATTTVPPTTTPPATTTTLPPTPTTLPATTTTLRVTTTVPPTTVPPPSTTLPPSTSTLAPTTSTSVPTSVLGARFESGGPSADLATTGFSGGPLVAFGAISILLGAALVGGTRLQAARD